MLEGFPIRVPPEMPPAKKGHQLSEPSPELREDSRPRSCPPQSLPTTCSVLKLLKTHSWPRGSSPCSSRRSQSPQDSRSAASSAKARRASRRLCLCRSRSKAAGSSQLSLTGTIPSWRTWRKVPSCFDTNWTRRGRCWWAKGRRRRESEIECREKPSIEEPSRTAQRETLARRERSPKRRTRR